MHHPVHTRNIMVCCIRQWHCEEQSVFIMCHMSWLMADCDVAL